MTNAHVKTTWSWLRFPTALIVIAFSIYAFAALLVHNSGDLADFKAFYCAGHVLLAHGQAYEAKALGACEASPAPSWLFVTRQGVVLPAPLPGYEILAFSMLAIVPFTTAAAIWLLILACALAASFVLLSRMGLGDVTTVAVACAIGLISMNIPTGELAPIAFLGVTLVAWGLFKMKGIAGSVVVGCGVALAFFEPQVGVAVSVACVALSRRSAVAAAAVICVLGALSLGALGVAGNIEYVRQVLPAHTLSELADFNQYSLSWVLNRVGVPPQTAISSGSLEWIGMLGVVAWFASTSFARKNPEMGIFGAAAFAVTGGPFLHLDHIGLALPAALWLASRVRENWIATAALVALAIPLFMPLSVQIAVPRPTEGVIIAIVAAWIGAAYGRTERAAIYSTAAICIALLVAAAALRAGGADVERVAAPLIPANLAQASWAQVVAQHSVITTWPIWLVKAPTWFALIATAAGCVAHAAKRPLVVPA